MPRIKAALLLCLSATAAVRAGAPNFTLKLLSPAEVKSVSAKLDKTLLPDGAGNVRVAGRQSFHVQIAGRTSLTLIPVQFSISETGLVQDLNRDTNACGIYLVEGTGKSHFEKLADGELAGLIQCDGVDGVGLAHSPNKHAQVILILGAHSSHRSWSYPYLVSWSDNDGRYVIETLSAPAWATPTDQITVAQARRWVAGHR